jgi:hypothetical protein
MQYVFPWSLNWIWNIVRKCAAHYTAIFQLCCSDEMATAHIEDGSARSLAGTTLSGGADVEGRLGSGV